jgi:type III restriction enzyme
MKPNFVRWQLQYTADCDFCQQIYAENRKTRPGVPMTLTVDNPILNSPYREPERYWLYDAAGMPRVENGRRPAGYYFRARARANERQLSMLSDEQFEELAVVNQVRQLVRAWRAAGYPGATPVTRQLLAHWTQPERERRLFFCQLEVAETVIWLVEIRGDRRLGIDVPLDTPLDGASKPLLRYAVKMATGSGKTVVMAMLMAWSILSSGDLAAGGRLRPHRPHGLRHPLHLRRRGPQLLPRLSGAPGGRRHPGAGGQRLRG